MDNHKQSTQNLAVTITSSASLQTYSTIRLLVDHKLVYDAYRAYAYFRWVDNTLDEVLQERPARLAFIECQKALIAEAYEGKPLAQASIEEQMILVLIQKDRNWNSGLHTYIDNMLDVMIFDAERRGRWISNVELGNYTHSLAAAVTEALHYYIGHNCPSPHCEGRYLAATGAHITHMLRDTLDDTRAGYFNIPGEYLSANHIGPMDFDSKAYRDWVQHRVKRARSLFSTGRGYLAKTPNLRCRLAGYAYIARFERVLDVIERDNYLLKSSYQECKTLAAGGAMAWSVLWAAVMNKPAQLGTGEFSGIKS